MKNMLKNVKKFNIDPEIMNAIFIVIFFSMLILSNFLIGFNLLIFLIMTFFGFTISIFYPRSGMFALTFLTIIFERFFTLSGIFFDKTEYKIYPLDIILLAIFSSIIIQSFFRIIKLKTLKKNDYFLLGFIFLNIIYFLTSLFIIKSNTALSFSMLKNYAFYPLIYFAIITLIRNKKDLARLFHFFLAGTIIIIGFLIFGIINGEGLWTEFTPLSTSGVRILAFTHGLYLSLSFVSLLIFAIYQKGKNMFAYFLLSVWGIGILGTMMRHLWVAIAFSIVFLYFLISKEKRKIFRGIFMKFIIAFVFVALTIFYSISMFPNSKLANFIEKTSSVLVERGASIARSRMDESFAWRELVWDSAYKNFKVSPIFGIGTGKTIYVESENYRDYVEVRNIHNSYLSVLIQLGFFGAGFFLWFLWKNIKLLLNCIRKKESFYNLSIFGALLIFIIAFSFQPYLETNLLSIFFWMSLGLSQKISTNDFDQNI